MYVAKEERWMSGRRCSGEGGRECMRAKSLTTTWTTSTHFTILSPLSLLPGPHSSSHEVLILSHLLLCCIAVLSVPWSSPTDMQNADLSRIVHIYTHTQVTPKWEGTSEITETGQPPHLLSFQSLWNMWLYFQDFMSPNLFIWLCQVLVMAFGGGNSNSLQYSCLKNPMDRGA